MNLNKGIGHLIVIVAIAAILVGAGTLASTGSNGKAASIWNAISSLFGSTTTNTIKGTGKDDSLHGTANDDIISGGKGNDFLWGHEGNDTLIGGVGADRYVLSTGGGHDTVTDFKPADGDVIIFSYDSPLYAMFVGPLSDGKTWTSYTGGQCSAKAGDFNGDGRTDTEIVVNDVVITLLGLSPEQLTGQMLLGG